MNQDQRIEVGKRLQEIRGSRDQRTFAEAVDSVQQTISKYERGEVPRSWMFLARLAEEEGVDLNLLLTGERLREAPSGSREDDRGERHGNGRTYPGSSEEAERQTSYARSSHS